MSCYTLDFVRKTYQAVRSHYNNLPLSLKSEQVDIISNFLNNKDGVAVLPTGFGKSLTFILPPLLCDEVSQVHNY